RGRHTRFSRDWSSDVCSSDLRIPETDLKPGQIMVFQVPIPEPLRFIEPSDSETRAMHALNDYGVMHVKLYEDIARYGHIATAYEIGRASWRERQEVAGGSVRL